MHRREIRSIELCAGAGGTVLGFEQAGIKTIAAFESNEWCCETLRENFPQIPIHKIGLKYVDFKPYKGTTILSAGFPCQPYSIAGRGLGLQDSRGQLVLQEIFRAIEEVEPELVFLENVTGLLRPAMDEILQFILSFLKNLYENVLYYVFDALEFGLAQTRKRLIIIASHRPIYLHSPTLSHTTLKEALENIPPSPCAAYNKKVQQLYHYIPQGGCWVDLPKELQREAVGEGNYTSSGGRRGIYKRLAWDKPSPTIVCSMVQLRTGRCHPDEDRPLSTRECARLQSFPDNFVFCGHLSSIYRQIGNAFPPKMAYALGCQISSQLL